MSRTVRFHEIGGPGVLQIDELDEQLPQEGEVRIKVEAIGLNRAEVMFRTGQYLEQPNLPSSLGYEASGIVDKVGRGVKDVKVGDRVSTIPSFSMGKYGVYGELAIVPEHAVAHYPANLSSEEGAAIWMAYMTVYGALIDIGKLGEGDYVAITAASSSVGIAAIQVAKAVNAQVIAVTRKADKVDFLLDCGADYVIATEMENLVDRVQAITSGNGANLIFDPVAGSLLTDLARCAAPQALIIEYGALAPESATYPLFESLAKGLSIKGYTLFEITGNPDRLKTAKDFIYKQLEAGKIKPVIDQVFDFEQIVAAHEYMESNVQRGKIVVSLRPEAKS